MGQGELRTGTRSLGKRLQSGDPESTPGETGDAQLSDRGVRKGCVVDFSR